MIGNGRGSQPLLERSSTHLALLSVGILLMVLRYVTVWTTLLWLVSALCALGAVWIISTCITNRLVKHRHFPPEPPERQAAKAFLAKLMGQKSQGASNGETFVPSGKLDETVQKLLDLVIRDFVLNWYQQLGTDQDRFKHLFKDFIWQMVEEFARRMKQIDIHEFITSNIVTILTKHLKEIQSARKKCKSRTAGPKFVLHPWLANEELEMEFIRQVAEVFLIHLMPQHYVQCVNARHLCRDVVASKIFKPCVEKICDPNYINEHLLSLLKYQQSVKKEISELCGDVTLCEGYMQLIADCNDIRQLELVRYKIISQILHTVANNNFCRSAGTDSNPNVSTKAPRPKNGLTGNETQTLKQLSVVKCCCEQKIQSLGGPQYISNNSEHLAKPKPDSEVLPFTKVMSTKSARNVFLDYLIRSEDSALLFFWAAVEDLKITEKRAMKDKLDQIYMTYMDPPCSKIRKLLGPSNLPAMTSVINGEPDVDMLRHAQGQIYSVLETKYYPGFIHSEFFHRVLNMDIDSPQIAVDKILPGMANELQSCVEDLQYMSNTELQSCVVDLQYMSNLGQMLDNEMHTLKTLLDGHCGNVQLERIKCEFQERITEIQHMKEEQKYLEMRISYGKLWMEHRWRMHISNVEILEENGEMFMKFVAAVHRIGCVISSGTSGVPDSWVLIRTLQDFHKLHAQLTQMQLTLPSAELPCISKYPDLSPDFLLQSKYRMQHYINEVLSSENLANTEAVFDFCCPGSDPLPPVDLSLSLDGSISPHVCSDSSTQTCDNMEERNPTTDCHYRNDCKASALYALVCEVFEEKLDKSRTLRLSETIGVFLHTAYGTTINRYLQHTIEWLCSDVVLVYMLERLTAVFWADGRFDCVPQSHPHNKTHVKQTLLNNIPGTLRSVIGEPNCRQGVSKTFEAFQDSRLNKHLFYSVLQEYMLEMFPELKAAQKQSPNVDLDRGEHIQNY